MNRKRRRTTLTTPAVPSTKHPSQQQYFRYVAAPEDNADDTGNGDENGDTINTNPRYVGGAFYARGPHQREVDEVDIPAPTEWLCHDAAASARLRTDAQTDLQLYPPRRPHHLPHSARQKRWTRDPAIGVAVARTLGSSKLGEDLRQERVICAGEVLPWGTWPARLRHHEGQSFYQDDCGGVGRGSYFHASGGGVGSSGGVGGVGIVSEGSIHDELLRRQLAPSSVASSSRRQHQQENGVTRLVPDERGRWVEAKTTIPPLLAAAAATVASSAGTSASAKYDSSFSLRPSLPPLRASSAGSTSAAIRLIPARYGGWVEFEESGKEGPHEPIEQRQKRRAALTMTARFGADGGGGCTGGGGGSDGGGGGGGSLAGVVPDGALPGSNLKEEEIVSSTEGPGEVGGGDGIGGCGATNGGSKGERRKRSCDTDACPSAGARSSGSGQGHSGTSGDESGGGYQRRGWTVSEPAKETVRRVWNRARRRARDSFEPRHRASPIAAADDGGTKDDAAAAVDTADAPTAVHGTVMRDQLDPALLSCLGRECEGIIDATLHVLLADRLRRLQSPLCTASSSTEEGNQSAPSPPPLETADWQDVLRAMRNCSEDARGSRTPANSSAGTASAAGAGVIDSLSKAAAACPGEQRVPEERERYGRDGVPGCGVMEKEVWGRGGSSDGSVVVVNDRLPGLPLNEAMLTRAYNRLLLYLHEKKTWQA